MRPIIVDAGITTEEVWEGFLEYLLRPDESFIDALRVGRVAVIVPWLVVPVRMAVVDSCPGCDDERVAVFPCGDVRADQMRFIRLGLRVVQPKYGRGGGLVAMPCCGWTGLIHKHYGTRPDWAKMRLSGQSVEFPRRK